MKIKYSILAIAAFFVTNIMSAQEFNITDVHVKKDNLLQQMVFTIEVEGLAGDSVPTANGALDGAPVLGYVFPTSLNPTDVGFDDTEGIVALALTSHPDFDDTPLWDENMDMDYANDGVVWHPHWVILESNTNVPGGLAVKATTENSVLPPTNPGMPMYMDSPGYPVIWSDNTIQCTVPLYRMNNVEEFNYDGVTALMYVNTSDPELPMLGVYGVYAVASGDLSLPYEVGNHTCDELIIDISTTSIGLVDPESITLYPNPTATEVHFDMSAGIPLGSYDIMVFDMNATLVNQTNINSNFITIPVENIGAAGTYVVQIVDTDSGEILGTKTLILID